MGGDITISGGSYNNQGGLASGVNIVGYGPSGSKIDDSGSGNLIASHLRAQLRCQDLRPGGLYRGAYCQYTRLERQRRLPLRRITFLRFEVTSNYAYTSWFEDNSDPARGITY